MSRDSDGQVLLTDFLPGSAARFQYPVAIIDQFSTLPLGLVIRQVYPDLVPLFPVCLMNLRIEAEIVRYPVICQSRRQGPAGGKESLPKTISPVPKVCTESF